MLTAATLARYAARSFARFAPGGSFASSISAFRPSELSIIHLRQSKTSKKLRVEISVELGALLERIRERKRGYAVHSTRLVVNEHGRSVTVDAMSRRWAKACAIAKVAGIQFRDLRAKAGTDKTDSAGDIRQAQRQLGHTSVVMTEHYVRNRRGAKVTPTR